MHGNAHIAIGIVYAPQFARLTRGAVLDAKQNDYVEAARALGVSGLLFTALSFNLLGGALRDVLDPRLVR